MNGDWWWGVTIIGGTASLLTQLLKGLLKSKGWGRLNGASAGVAFLTLSILVALGVAALAGHWEDWRGWVLVAIGQAAASGFSYKLASEAARRKGNGSVYETPRTPRPPILPPKA